MSVIICSLTYCFQLTKHNHFFCSEFSVVNYHNQCNLSPVSVSDLTSTGIISDVDDGQCSSYVAMMVAFRASHGFSLMCFSFCR